MILEFELRRFILKIGIFTLLLLCCVDIIAQQIPYNNTYLTNRYSLSPAYTGYFDHYSVFMTYRRQWFGFENAPESKIISADVPLANRTGIGLQARSDSYGIFKNNKISVSFAHRIHIGHRHTISLGTSLDGYEHKIDFSTLPAEQLTDPEISNMKIIPSYALNGSFAILHHLKKWNSGIVIQRILENKVNHEITGLANSNSFVYPYARHFMFHTSYELVSNRLWLVEPVVLLRKTMKSPLLYEVAVLARYRNRV